MINLILSSKQAVIAVGFLAAVAGSVQTAADASYASARACLRDANEVEEKIASKKEAPEEVTRAVETAKDYCIQTRYQRARDLLEEAREKLDD